MASQIAIPSSTLDQDDSPAKGNRRSILSSMSPSKNAPRLHTNGLGRPQGDGDAALGSPLSPASPRSPLGSTDTILRSRKRGEVSNGTGPKDYPTLLGSPAPPLAQVKQNGHAPPNGEAAAAAPAASNGESNNNNGNGTTKNGKINNDNVNGTTKNGSAKTSQASLDVPSGGFGKLRRRMSNLSINSQKSQDDRASIHSNFSSHRDAISSFIRRKTIRGGSEPPEANFVDDDQSIAGAESVTGAEPTRRSSFMRKRTISTSTSRMKLGRFGSKSKGHTDTEQGEEDGILSSKKTGNGSVAGNSGPSLGSDEIEGDAPSRSATRSKILRDSYQPVGYPSPKKKDVPATNTPAARVKRAEQARAASQDAPDQRGPTNGYTREAKTASSAETKEDGSARTKSVSTGEQSSPPQQGYIGAAAATVGGLLGFGAAAEAADGYHSDSDGSEDEFHDADLGDIHEEDEEEDRSRERDEGNSSDDDEREEKSDQHTAPPDHASQQSAYARAGRHRGMSEASGKDQSVASQKKGNGGLRRTTSPEEIAEGADNKTGVGASGPARLKGTSGAKRRAGSAPITGTPTDEDGPSATPTDAKAKKETPAAVKDKAARVAKMDFDDVKEDADEMREDIEIARGALHLFLNSRMLEAEEIIKTKADTRMYYALGNCLIATMKGFMTFEPEDLATAISYCKDAMHIAHLLRKPSNTVANFGRFVRGSGHSPSALASMTQVQRHAELVYVEAQLLKSCLGIVYSGDFFGFVAEALNMRNAYGVYRSLAKYVDTADSKAPGKHDDDIDEDFRSGVYLGSGLITMILGLLPGKILGLMSAFGYEGDTKAGLETLMRAGGWKTSGQDRPTMGIKDEGIRRSVCDMGILLFHLVVSVFIPVTGVDIGFADRILHYHLKRYPNGVFFLYFSGRLYSTQARCEKAIKQYAAARDAQEEYIQLKHISWWDASLCHMSLAQWRKAQSCFEVLLKESNWSKCVYTYGVAANLAQAEEEEAAEGTGGAAKGKANTDAARLFAKVPGLMQRIAGKSIPMEKFVAKKAAKFNQQGRLLLPAVEFSYIYHCLSNAPRYALTDEHLVMISDALADLNEHASKKSSYHSGEGEYWDDFCLAHFLRAVVLRHIATPEAHAKADARDKECDEIPQEEAQEQAMLSLQMVLENGHKITTDHYIIYFSHYELGRLHADKGEYDEAKKQLEMVLSGKMLEDKGTRKGNHKYGMQNMALLRSNGALNNLKQQGH